MKAFCQIHVLYYFVLILLYLHYFPSFWFTIDNAWSVISVLCSVNIYFCFVFIACKLESYHVTGVFRWHMKRKFRAITGLSWMEIRFLCACNSRSNVFLVLWYNKWEQSKQYEPSLQLFTFTLTNALSINIFNYLPQNNLQT